MKLTVAIISLVLVSTLIWAQCDAVVIFVEELDESISTISRLDGISTDVTVKALKERIAVVKGVPLGALHLLLNNIAELHEASKLGEAADFAAGDIVTVVIQGALKGVLFIK